MNFYVVDGCRTVEPNLQQSFFGNLMVPDFGGLVEATLAAAGEGGAPSSPSSDVDSVFGTLRGGFAGTVRRSLHPVQDRHLIPVNAKRPMSQLSRPGLMMTC